MYKPNIHKTMKKRGFVGPLVLILAIVAIGIGYYLYTTKNSELARSNYAVPEGSGDTSVGVESLTAAAGNPSASPAVTGTPTPSVKFNRATVGLPNTGGNITTGTAGYALTTTTPVPAPYNPNIYTTQSGTQVVGQATISGTMQPIVTNATEKMRTALMSFRLTAPSNAPLVVTHLVIGSPVGNDVFNYVENVKANVNGMMIPLWFSNEYVEGTTVWKLETPLTLAQGGSVVVTLYADVKPGLHNASFTMVVKGGRANVALVGSVTGPTISVK